MNFRLTLCSFILLASSFSYAKPSGGAGISLGRNQTVIIRDELNSIGVAMNNRIRVVFRNYAKLHGIPPEKLDFEQLLIQSSTAETTNGVGLEFAPALEKVLAHARQISDKVSIGPIAELLACFYGRINGSDQLKSIPAADKVKAMAFALEAIPKFREDDDPNEASRLAVKALVLIWKPTESPITNPSDLKIQADLREIAIAATGSGDEDSQKLAKLVQGLLAPGPQEDKVNLLADWLGAKPGEDPVALYRRKMAETNLPPNVKVRFCILSANIESVLGHRKRALGSINEATQIITNSGGPIDKADVAVATALVYLQLGEFQECLDVLHSPAANLIGPTSDGGGRRDEVAYLRLLWKARALVGLHKDAEAVEVANKAIEIGKPIRVGKDFFTGASVSQAGALGVRADALIDLGKLDEAIASYREALKNYVWEPGSGISIGLAKGLFLKGDSLEARTVAENGQVAISAGGYAASEAEYDILIAQTWAAQGRRDVAVLYGKLAINRDQELSFDSKSVSEAARQVFHRKVGSDYRSLAGWLVAEGRIPEAERTLELLRDDEFFQFLHVRSGTDSHRLDLTSREQSWADQAFKTIHERVVLDAKIQVIDKLKEAERDPGQKQQLVELAKRKQQIEVAYQRLFAVSTPDPQKLIPASVEKLGNLLSGLPVRTAAVFTLVSDGKVCLFLTLPGAKEPILYTSAFTTRDLNQKILEFNELITDPKQNPQNVGAQLYELLVRPLDSDLRKAGVTTLIWSLDGSLRYVPLCALYDSHAHQYLIQEFDSAVFSPQTVGRLAETSLQGPSTAVFGVSEGGLGFAPLPAVKEEMEAIRASSGAHTYLNDAFTLTALQGELDLKSVTIHFATHFKFVPGDSDASCLLLGKNKVLSIDQIQGMKSDVFASVNLLVLSACETAVGNENADGSEFEGFALLAQLKKAQAVMATLWPISDEGTSVFMGEFYRLRKIHSEWTKLELLSHTQLEFIDGTAQGFAKSGQKRSVEVAPKPGEEWPATLPRFSHPFHWPRSSLQETGDK